MWTLAGVILRCCGAKELGQSCRRIGRNRLLLPISDPLDSNTVAILILCPLTPVYSV